MAHGERVRVVGLDEDAAPARELLGQRVDGGRDHGDAEPHGQHRALRPRGAARGHDVQRRPGHEALGVRLPAREADDLRQPEVGGALLEHGALLAVAHDERRRRVGELGQRVDEHVGAPVTAQAPGERDPRARQDALRQGVEARDRRLAAPQARVVDADPPGPGARSGPVGEQPLQPRGGGAGVDVVRLAAPPGRAVLARHERRGRRRGARGRPPRAEHVRVDQVGLVEAVDEPLGEGGRRLGGEPARVREELDRVAVGARQVQPGGRRVADDQTGGDPVRAQRPAQAQRAELRAARLEDADHACQPHRALILTARPVGVDETARGARGPSR